MDITSGFMVFTKTTWSSYPTVGGMRGLCAKLRAFKKDIRRWNMDVFGNVFNMVETAEHRARSTEIAFDQDPTEQNRMVYFEAQSELRHATNIEMEYWKQKARVKWLKEGDCSSRHFHSIVKDKHRRQRLHGIYREDGTYCDTSDSIGHAAVKYFTRMFTAQQVDDATMFLSSIPSLITAEDNLMLTAIPSLEEVKEAVWSLDPHSAAGPDGFNGWFFRTWWEIICVDVYKAVQEYFLGFPVPRAMAHSMIVLIPKGTSQRTFSDFRPIALSTFMSKIQTRIIATRLNTLLPKIISPEQAGFQKGRGITEHVLLANELIHWLDKGTRPNKAILKLDMAKTFDIVNWQYLQSIMKCFGFSSWFITLVLNHLEGTHISILVNGLPHGFFRPTRGVKQGDPLSPLLFILAAKGFSRGLKHLIDQNVILPYSIGRIPMTISHLSYADDLLIFLAASRHNLHNFKQFLSTYERVSGQAVNWHKSSVVYSDAVIVSQRQTFTTLLGMRQSNLPMKYLGSYLHKGITRTHHCHELLNHVDSKLNGWHAKLLCFAGRIVLIRPILLSIPLHVLAASSIPRSIIKSLERRFAVFLWGADRRQ